MLGWKKTVTNNVDNPEKPIIFQFDIHLARKAHFYIVSLPYVLLCYFKGIVFLTSYASCVTAVKGTAAFVDYHPHIFGCLWN